MGTLRRVAISLFLLPAVCLSPALAATKPAAPAPKKPPAKAPATKKPVPRPVPARDALHSVTAKLPRLRSAEAVKATVEVPATALTAEVIEAARPLAQRKAVEAQARAFLPAGASTEALQPVLAAAPELAGQWGFVDAKVGGGIAKVTLAFVVSPAPLVDRLVGQGLLPRLRLLVHAAPGIMGDLTVAGAEIENAAIGPLLDAGYRVFPLALAPDLAAAAPASIGTPEEAAVLRKAAEATGAELAVLIDGATGKEQPLPASLIRVLPQFGIAQGASRPHSVYARAHARVVVARTGEVLATDSASLMVTTGSADPGAIARVVAESGRSLAARLVPKLAALSPAALAAAGVRPEAPSGQGTGAP